MARAVEAAAEGFRAWSGRRAAERTRVLWQAAALLRGADDLVTLEVRDTGKPVAKARGYDVPSAAEALEYFAGLAQLVHGGGALGRPTRVQERHRR